MSEYFSFIYILLNLDNFLQSMINLNLSFNLVLLYKTWIYWILNSFRNKMFTILIPFRAVLIL